MEDYRSNSHKAKAEAKEAEKAIVKEFVKFVKKCEEYDTK